MVLSGHRWLETISDEDYLKLNIQIKGNKTRDFQADLAFHGLTITVFWNVIWKQTHWTEIYHFGSSLFLCCTHACNLYSISSPSIRLPYFQHSRLKNMKGVCFTALLANFWSNPEVGSLCQREHRWTQMKSIGSSTLHSNIGVMYCWLDNMIEK